MSGDVHPARAYTKPSTIMKSHCNFFCYREKLFKRDDARKALYPCHNHEYSKTHLSEQSKEQSIEHACMRATEVYREETNVLNFGSARRSGGHDCRVHFVHPEPLVIATD